MLPAWRLDAVTETATIQRMRNRISELREARGWSQQELADRLKTTRQTVFRLEKNQRRVSDVWIGKLTAVFDCAPGDLFAAPDPSTARTGHALPVIDYVQAGAWTSPADPYAKGDGMAHVFPATRVGPKAFALQIRGDSMEPEFREGDRVIVDPALDPLPGDFVVAKLEDEQEATFKKYRPLGAGKAAAIELIALNPDWPALRIDRQHPGRIVATMVEHHRYRRR
jgi:SOS-response transcriptional repressor LexA